MKDQLKPILSKLKPAQAFAKKYLNFIILLIFLLLYTFMVVRIDSLSGAAPSDAQVTAKEQAIAQPKIDKATLNKIEKLQNQNIQVQALFNQARNDPFSE
ncbi:MAG TPA: hypothetical protein VLG47_01550 [Candidatus Saccharimonadales bacterium]|nr:hypothetical protein [Candidatus Saccharimonadales bacterium]